MPHQCVWPLQVIHLPLKHFLPQLQERHVLVRSDNVVVFYINHQEGTKSMLFPHVPAPSGKGIPPPVESAGSPATTIRWQMSSFLQASPRGVNASHRGCGQGLADVLHGGGGPVCLEGVNPLPSLVCLEREECHLGTECPAPQMRRCLHECHHLLLVASFWPGRIWFSLLQKLCCGLP